MTTTRNPRRRPRRGMLSMELVITLPILGVLLLGLLEFSLLFFARGDVVEASRNGARHATLQGSTPEGITAEVLNSLSPRLQRGAVVRTKLSESSGDQIVVGVSVPMSAAAPDLLWPIGFGLRGRELYCETSMVKE